MTKILNNRAADAFNINTDGYLASELEKWVGLSENTHYNFNYQIITSTIKLIRRIHRGSNS